MKNKWRSMATLIAVATLGLTMVGCFQSTSLAPSSGAAYSGKPGTGGLSFTFKQSPASKGLTVVTGVGYVVVQISSEEQKSSYFQATAVDAGGNATVTFGNLIPGVWHATARLYDSLASGNLLYFGNTSTTVLSGVSNSANLPVYATASLDLNISPGVYADTVTVTDQFGLSTEDFVTMGGDKLLIADLTAAEGTPDQQVYWSSSNPAVASIGSSGQVHGVGTGTATITAMAKYGGVSGTYLVNVVSQPYVGIWENINSSDGTFYTVYDIHDDGSYTKYWWSYNGSVEADKGTILTPSASSIQFNQTQQLSLSTGTYGSYTMGASSQLNVDLSSDGQSLTLTDTMMSSSVTYFRINHFVPVTSLTATAFDTVNSVTADPLALIAYTWYNLQPSFNAGSPVTVEAFAPYAILDADNADTDVTGIKGSFSTTQVNFSYSGNFKLMMRSLSNPDVTYELDVSVTGGSS